METAQNNSVIPPEVIAELEEAARRAAAGVRDSESMRRAWERMDRIREENRQKFGDADIGVQIIGELRDSE